MRIASFKAFVIVTVSLEEINYVLLTFKIFFYFIYFFSLIRALEIELRTLYMPSMHSTP